MVGPVLNAQEQQAVAEALTRAKTRTNGEIMVVVTWESDRYMAAALVFSLALTVMTATALYLLHPVYGVPAMALLTGGLFFLFLGTAELLHLPTCFLPRGVKRRAAHRHAREQFAAHALHATPGRAAILILLSMREHAVEILADEGIYTKADAARWPIIAGDLADSWKRGERARPLCQAIDECAALLATHFPA